MTEKRIAKICAIIFTILMITYWGLAVWVEWFTETPEKWKDSTTILIQSIFWLVGLILSLCEVFNDKLS